MAIGIRDVSEVAFAGTSAWIPALRCSKGDLLICFHSSDLGSVSDMGISGGQGGWQLVTSRGGVPDGWGGTRISRRTATASEPDYYTLTQSAGADGVAVIVAIRDAKSTGIVATQAGEEELTWSVTMPGAAPPTAGCLMLRWGAGTQYLPGGPVWWFTPGHQQVTQLQSRDFASAVLAYRLLPSSVPVPEATFRAEPFVEVWHGFTVIVPPGAGSSPPPTPVPLPGFAPGRGDALYAYYFRRLLDGQVLGTLDLAGVSFDKRILQAGTFQASIPIPNRMVRSQVAEIIPDDPSVLTTGPGVICVVVLRAGEPWGEYWITGARKARSRRGTPVIQIRGSTLDAYLQQVEIQEDLEYENEDQVEIARQLLTHMQQQPNANISLVLQPGNSGVVQSRTYLASDGGRYGQRLAELAESETGFEWTINITQSSGGLQREWVWGHPRLGSDEVNHVFVDGRYGGDILEWDEDEDALRGATRWRARGTAPTSDVDASTTSTPLVSSVHEASRHLEAGWPRIDRTLSRQGEVTQQTLEEYAAYWAANASGVLRVESYTVALGAEPTINPNRLGDKCRIWLDNEWHLPHWRERRIIGLRITPVSRQTGKEECQLVLESTEVAS